MDESLIKKVQCFTKYVELLFFRLKGILDQMGTNRRTKNKRMYSERN